MNKKAAIQSLQNIANYLDNSNLHTQADSITSVMTKIAQGSNFYFSDFGDGARTEIEPSTPPILKDIPSQNIELENPKITDIKTEEIKVGNETISIPSKLLSKGTMKFGDQLYRLYYDKNKKEFYYLSADGKKGVPLDANGEVKEVRNKKRDWWKQIGMRRLFGDWKLPNLNKSIAVEPYLRKKVIPEISRAVRPLGNALRDNVTRPVTDILGAAGDELGIKSPSRDDPHMADAKFNLGNSDNRETVPSKVPNTGDKVNTEIKTQEPSGPKPVEPPKTDGAKDVVKSRGSELKDITTANDLLFWSMSVSLGKPYGPGLAKDVIEKPEYYYNRQNMSKIVGLIVKLAESPSVAKINSRIKGLRSEAINMLYAKIRDTEKVK